MLSLSQCRPTPNHKVVLLTGAAGAIRTSLRHQLGNDYHFRLTAKVRQLVDDY
ncbi:MULTISPECIES: hypothetical protein [unclassified Nostoc]|uniref:hypothetical protein n=1 Tax=unclassified Nostoc TaxID=2593658 RepID=UPI002612E650|nr:hypothetical protein [Nostoc sp. S13]MDF5738739.1 hypothetical protein [Nostoc sp. S13]